MTPYADNNSDDMIDFLKKCEKLKRKKTQTKLGLPPEKRFFFRSLDLDSMPPMLNHLKSPPLGSFAP